MFQYTQETVSDQIIMEFAKTVELFGLTTLEARLFAYMYLEDRPLTLDDMSEAIGKSKTSMSNGIRGLLDLKLVTRVWKKGERKDLYQASSRLFHVFMDAYLQKWVSATQNQQEALMHIKEATRSEDLNPSTLKQLEHMIEFHHNVQNSFSQLKNISASD